MVSPVVEPVTDIVQMLHHEVDEEDWGEDGDDSRDDAELLRYGDTIDRSGSRSHQHLEKIIKS